MNTISDQPMPISSRFAPVMLASTSEQLEAPSAPGALQLAPYCSTSLPPFQANTNPTAYSGRTPLRAKTARGRLGMPEVEQLGQAEVGPGDAGRDGQGQRDRPTPGGGGGRLGVSCQRVLRLGRVPWGPPDGWKVSSAREAGGATGGHGRAAARLSA